MKERFSKYSEISTKNGLEKYTIKYVLEYLEKNNGKTRENDYLYIFIKNDVIVLYDGFEYYDGNNWYEFKVKYSINSNVFENILLTMPNKYRDECILNEFCEANECYCNLNKMEKLIFIYILQCYKNGNKYYEFIKILDENNIHYVKDVYQQ